MFSFFRRRDVELQQLKVQVEQLKSASPLLAAVGGSGSCEAGGASSVNLGSIREQLAHNRGHVFTCVNAIASRVAGQRLCVAVRPAAPSRFMSKSAVDELEPLESHPLIDALNDPNEAMIRWSLLHVTVASLKLTGTAYWWIRENDDGRLGFWPLPSHWVTPIHASGKLFTRWKVRPDGQAEAFYIDGPEVAYFYNPDPSDWTRPLSTLAALAASINADDNIQRSHSAAFANGIHPGLVIKAGSLETPGGDKIRRTLTPEQRKQLIEAIRRAHGGVMLSNEPIILDSMIESVTPYSLKPNELDFLASSKLTKSRIYAGFGVNPMIVGEIEGANRAQAVVAESNFCNNVINPLLTLLGQTITEFVCPWFAADGQKLVAWFEPAIAHDDELHSKNWTTAINRGIVTPNEFRRAVLNLPDIDGGDELPAPAAPVAAGPSSEPDDDEDKSLDDLIVKEWDPYELLALQRIKREDVAN